MYWTYYNTLKTKKGVIVREVLLCACKCKK